MIKVIRKVAWMDRGGNRQEKGKRDMQQTPKAMRMWLLGLAILMTCDNRRWAFTYLTRVCRNNNLRNRDFFCNGKMF